MDVVAACRAFVAVSGHGSFTSGAAAAGIPQSVASRRIAALEKHFGARLFDRSSRAVRLTSFGQDMLPSARRLVDLADAMGDDAERARMRPLRVAVPEICPPHRLADLVVAARRQRMHLEVRPAGPQERARLCRTLEVGAGIVAVPEAAAAWRVPLGLAARTPFPAPTVFLETLRSGRARTQARRRILVQPEDDVAHLRDPLTRAGQSAGLVPAQVTVASSLVDAAAAALDSPDLLLCSHQQAEDFGLHWRPLAGPRLLRGYDVAAGVREDLDQIGTVLYGDIARCLGAPDGHPGSAGGRAPGDRSPGGPA
ncbi:LysR family transcriptional regulator [Micromonospora echinofusca]|uniref:DNA-binding transcriptional regulator, LysR family n=1 Tax=Micromonospora echinofusca TaxID=47858 RepID=A0A1C5G7G8_MICEH|nr:LysR family transcriptional regulator [Micromonospora echinofusca]SCG15670.1 DNA-binding transcriptional regulator, LysR family [Micromonospora echinofusca]